MGESIPIVALLHVSMQYNDMENLLLLHPFELTTLIVLHCMVIITLLAICFLPVRHILH